MVVGEGEEAEDFVAVGLEAPAASGLLVTVGCGADDGKGGVGGVDGLGHEGEVVGVRGVLHPGVEVGV